MRIRVRARYEDRVLKPLEELGLEEGEEVEIEVKKRRLGERKDILKYAGMLKGLGEKEEKIFLEAVKRRSWQNKAAVDEFVNRVLEKYRNKIESIVLFGSVARGEARKDSDVDILVVFKERNIADMKEIYGIAFEVSIEHSLDISPKVYAANDILNMMKIGAPFIKEILRDGVSLYGKIRTGKITV